MEKGEIIKLNCDGSCYNAPNTRMPRGIGIVIHQQDNDFKLKVARNVGLGTSNDAEYIALQTGLKLLLAPHIKERFILPTKGILLQTDSELLVHQVIAKVDTITPTLIAHQAKVVELMEQVAKFYDCSIDIKHISRAWNSEADRLAGMAREEGFRDYMEGL